MEQYLIKTASSSSFSSFSLSSSGEVALNGAVPESGPRLASFTHDHVYELVWKSLVLHTRLSLKTSYIEKTFKSKHALQQYMKLPSLEFAPALLETLVADSPPTAEWFKSLPPPAKKNYWAVYVVVLEKEGHKPRVYIGSGCARDLGVTRRWMAYNGDPQMTGLPRHMKASLEQGFVIKHKGCLATMPPPAAIHAPEIALFFRVLEASFAVNFWAFWSSVRNVGGALLAEGCLWKPAELTYDGLCSHTSMMEGTKGLQMEFAEREQREEVRSKRVAEQEAKREEREETKRIRLELDTPFDIERREKQAERDRLRWAMGEEERKKLQRAREQEQKERHAQETQEEAARRLALNSKQRDYNTHFRDPTVKKLRDEKREAREMKRAQETQEEKEKRIAHNERKYRERDARKDPEKRALLDAKKAEQEAKKANETPAEREKRERKLAATRRFRENNKNPEFRAQKTVKKELLLALETIDEKRKRESGEAARAKFHASVKTPEALAQKKAVKAEKEANMTPAQRRRKELAKANDAKRALQRKEELAAKKAAKDKELQAALEALR